jgi:hypothetical protein
MAFDWKATLGTIAPTIATALGGPLAGLATKAIVGALGLGESASEAEIARAVAGATPEQLLALKQADNQLVVDLERLGVEREKIAHQDRASARDREARVMDWTPKVLATVIIGGFLATVYMVLAGYVDGLKDPLTAALVGTLIGYVSAKADQVTAYYFGSTSQSKSKDDTIKNLSK